MKYRLIAAAVFAFCTGAIAQAPAAAPTTAPLAKHECKKPALPDAGKKLSTEERNTVVKNLEGYRACIRTFSDGQEKIKAEKELAAKTQQDAANASIAAAKAAAAAVDAAVKDYNDFSAEVVKIVNVEPKTGTNLPAPARPAKNY